MSDTDEPYVEPAVSAPEASYDVVRETYQPPTASIESVKADTLPRASVETVQLSEDPKPAHPQPSVDYEKKGLGLDGRRLG